MTGGLLSVMGQPAEGQRELDRALALAREHGEEELLGWTHELNVYGAEFRGDAEQALGHARRAVEIAERIGSALSRASAYYSLGCANLVQQDWPAAENALERALAIVRERRTGLHWEPLIVAGLAEVHLARGDGERARALAEEAARRAARFGARVTECRAQLTLARALLRSEGAATRGAAEAALRRARALVAESGARLYEPLVGLELAELARLAGDEDGHRRQLGEAERLFAALGAPARCGPD